MPSRRRAGREDQLAAANPNSVDIGAAGGESNVCDTENRLPNTALDVLIKDFFKFDVRFDWELAKEQGRT